MLLIPSDTPRPRSPSATIDNYSRLLHEVSPPLAPGPSQPLACSSLHDRLQQALDKVAAGLQDDFTFPFTDAPSLSFGGDGALDCSMNPSPAPSQRLYPSLEKLMGMALDSPGTIPSHLCYPGGYQEDREVPSPECSPVRVHARRGSRVASLISSLEAAISPPASQAALPTPVHAWSPPPSRLLPAISPLGEESIPYDSDLPQCSPVHPLSPPAEWGERIYCEECVTSPTDFPEELRLW